MYKKLFAGCLFSSAKSRDNHASLPATTSLSQTVLSGDKGSEEDVSSGKDAIIRAVSRRSLSPDDSAQLCKLPADIAAAEGYPYQVHELGPPKPPCQKDRMRTMEVLGLIDAPPDPELDSILKLITGIFDAPTALIGLFDDKKIFIKDATATTGSFKRGDFPWRWSFCGWTMASQNNQIMVIPDAFEDARFADNVNVRPPGGGPGVRFYCGTPLIASNGHRLGTLCFADTKPRSFDAGQCAILNNMSEMVVRHIEKDIVLQMQQHDNKVLSEAYTQVERALDCFDHCVVLLDTSGPEFKVMYLNAAWDKLTGIPRDQATGHILPDLMEHKLGGHVLGPEHVAAVKKGMEFSVPDAMIKGMAGDKVFILRFRPATQNQLDAYAIPIGVPSFIKSATPEQEASPKLYFMAIEAPSSVASTCSTRSGVSRIREAGEAIEGLAVGHLLGKGSFGDVYSATWFGTTVAVKVIEQDVSDTTAANLEAALAAKLRHPHIVQTLQHFTRKTGRRPQSSSVNYKRSSGTGSGTGSDLLSPAMVSARIGMSPNDTPEGSGSPAPHWAVINFGDRSGGPSASDVGSGMIVCTSAMPPMPAFPTFQHDGADNAPLETVQTWIIMEFCNKGCLQDAIDRGWMRDAPSCVSGKPKMPDVLATAYEIASALCYLHCQGVVHGDLSAYNVLLTSTGTSSTNSRGFSAKIADFGLARALGDVRSKIQTKTYGTLTHQPPETLTAGLISKAVDVYSFGVLLWQMYTFSRPWSGLTHGQIVTQVVSGNSKLHFPAGTPQAFQQLAASCMAFKAEDRPTMEDICQTLEEMVSGDYW